MEDAGPLGIIGWPICFPGWSECPALRCGWPPLPFLSTSSAAAMTPRGTVMAPTPLIPSRCMLSRNESS